MGVPYAVIMDKDDVQDNEIKDDEIDDIWWKAPKSKIDEEEVYDEVKERHTWHVIEKQEITEITQTYLDPIKEKTLNY